MTREAGWSVALGVVRVLLGTNNPMTVVALAILLVVLALHVTFLGLLLAHPNSCNGILTTT